MKIIQITENLAYGDGSSNCILSISAILDELKYPNIIMAFRVDRLLKNEKIVEANIFEPIDADIDDIIIYHLYTGNSLNYIMENFPYKKILVYHNVTPPEFFRGIDDDTFQSCLWGLYDASRTAGKYLRSIVLSEFSKHNLLQFGWKQEEISVIPLIKTNHIDIDINYEIIDKYKDGYVNFLSVGRIAPNKKIEDVIRVFSYYQKHFNHKSRLVLAGNIIYQNYYEALLEYVESLQADHVIFTNRIANEDLEAYYAVSNIYLCMSDHEGFCIPLVEAMKRELPIVAYSSTAVPDTLGGAGVLLDSKDETKIAQFLVQLLNDDIYRNNIISSQKERLKALSLENYKDNLKKLIEEVRGIKSDSYSMEPKGISVSYMLQSEIKLKPRYLKDLKNMSQDKERIVIYGIGKAGKRLLGECEKYERDILKKIILCDNAAEEGFRQMPVMKHEKCVKKYKSALYIVTVQKSFADIFADLLNSGIEKENIRFFDSAYNRIF